MEYEEEQEPGTEDMRRNRSGFKNNIENLLREAFGAFTEGEIANVNDHPKGKDFLAWHWEETVEISLDLHLYSLFQKTTGDFDRRQAAEEMIAETKLESERFWEVARRSFGRIDKRSLSTIRLPDNAEELEGEFWGRVDVAITEALEGKRGA